MVESYSIREYQPKDKAAIFALKTAVDGRPFSEELWQWKFETGPVRPAQIFVVDGQNGIAGLRIFIIERLKVMDKTMTAGLGVEVMVHPDYRRFRIASLMAAEGFESMLKKGVPILLGFPNEAAYKVYSKTRPNWGPVCVIPLSVKPLNFDKIIGQYTGSRFARRIAGTVAKLGWSIVARERRSGPATLDIQQIESFDARFDVLWRETCYTYEIGLVRDSAFLNWRFANHPRNYTIFAAASGDKICGYMVLKNDEMFNLRLGLIVDTLTLPDETVAAALITRAVDHFRKQNVDAIGCLMLKHAPYFKTLRKAGFLAIPTRFSPKRFFFGVQMQPGVASREQVYDCRRWYLTFADIDIT